MAIKALYNYRVFFRLKIDGNYHIIDEPIGWDAVSAELPRDKDFFGFVSDFFKDDYMLGFGQDDIGFSLIEDLYERDGQDGEAIFEFCYYEPGTDNEVIPFTGKVNLNTYSIGNGEIKCSIEKVSFESLFRTRFDTDIDLTSDKDLDGNSIVPCPLIGLQLHSKSIVKQFLSEIVPGSYESFNSGVISRFASIKLSSVNEITSELAGNQQIPASVNGIYPPDDSLYFFKAEEAGIYDFNFIVIFTLQIFRGDFGGRVGNYTMVPRFALERGGNVIEVVDFNNNRVSGGTSERIVRFDYGADISFTRNIEVGDNIYLWCDVECQYAGAPYVYSLENFRNKIDIKAQTTAASSKTDCYRIFDVINYLLGSATGVKDALKSTILSEGGILYNNVVASGYQIRNFLSTDKPVKISLKSVFEGLFPPAALGYSFKNINGKDFLEIESFENYFQDKFIAEVGDISDYTEEHGKDLVFNEFEFGYEKYPEDSVNTLDEFNTYKTGLIPVKSCKSKFTKKSKWITSGYLIEEQRREQFKENPSSSIGNDDEIFMISVVDVAGVLRAEKNENFTDVSGVYSPDTIYNLIWSPTRVQYNWSRFLNISLIKKNNTEIIKSTFIKNNDKLKSSLLPSDTRKRHEPNSIIEEIGDVTVDTFRSGNRSAIHSAKYANFKSVIDYDIYILIKKSLTGEGSVDHNYGYIVHVDDKGKRWKSFVYSMSYLIGDRMATFKVAKIELLN